MSWASQLRLIQEMQLAGRPAGFQYHGNLTLKNIREFFKQIQRSMLVHNVKFLRSTVNSLTFSGFHHLHGAGSLYSSFFKIKFYSNLS